MTIEIHEPELEAMIQQRLDSGQYKDVEDMLLQAFKPKAKSLEGARDGFTGEELIAAFQRSPHKEIELAQSSVYSPVRDVEL